MPALITWWTLDVRGVAPHAPDHDVVARAGVALLARWNEPARRYHTTTHLLEMFAALAELVEAREIDARQCSVARLAPLDIPRSARATGPEDLRPSAAKDRTFKAVRSNQGTLTDVSTPRLGRRRAGPR